MPIESSPLESIITGVEWKSHNNIDYSIYYCYNNSRNNCYISRLINVLVLFF